MTKRSVRFAVLSDVPDMVSVHLASFPGFFLTFLGRRFLYLLYANILDIPENISLVVVDDEQIIQGFVVGTLSPEGLYKRLLAKSWFKFACAAVLPAIQNPRCIPRLFRAFKAPKIERTKSADCLLMSIGVHPHEAGVGSGRLLVEKFLEIAALRGAEEVSLTTDKLNNAGVNRFYLNAGFELKRSFVTPEGREMNEYQHFISVKSGR